LCLFSHEVPSPPESCHSDEPSQGWHVRSWVRARGPAPRARRARPRGRPARRSARRPPPRRRPRPPRAPRRRPPRPRPRAAPRPRAPVPRPAAPWPVGAPRALLNLDPQGHFQGHTFMLADSMCAGHHRGGTCARAAMCRARASRLRNAPGPRQADSQPTFWGLTPTPTPGLAGTCAPRSRRLAAARSSAARSAAARRSARPSSSAAAAAAAAAAARRAASSSAAAAAAASAAVASRRERAASATAAAASRVAAAASRSPAVPGRLVQGLLWWSVAGATARQGPRSQPQGLCSRRSPACMLPACAAAAGACAWLAAQMRRRCACARSATSPSHAA